MNKIVSLSIAAVVPLAFAGCSQETTDSVASDAASNAEVVESAAEEATSAAAEAADDVASKASDAASEADDAADDASPSPDASASVQGGSVEDAAKARELAIAHIAEEQGAEGVVIAQDLEDRAGKWDVDVLLGENLHEVKVNTADGSTKTDETEAADDEDRRTAASEVTIEKAIEAALADTPGIIEDASWDEDGAEAWEVEIVPEGQDDDVEVQVDPGTGEVSKG